MSDKSQFKEKLLIVLVLVLLLIAGVQAGFIHIMREQIELIDQQQSSSQHPLQQQAQDKIQSSSAIKEDTMEANDNLVAQNTAGNQQPALKQNLQIQTAQQQGQKNALDDAYMRRHAPTWGRYADSERMRRNRDMMLSQNFNPNYDPPDFQRHFRLSTSTPEIDVNENEHQYMVSVNLPGANKNDISVSLDGQRLTIKGKRIYQQQGSNPTGNIIFKERQSGRFQRSISLTHPVHQNRMKTRLDNGILKILIPKITDRQWRQ